MTNLIWTVNNAARQRLTGYIPKIVFKVLFVDLLNRRGAQIYVIHQFFSKFYPALVEAIQQDPETDPHDHAEILLSRLNFNKQTNITDESIPA